MVEAKVMRWPTLSLDAGERGGATTIFTWCAVGQASRSLCAPLPLIQLTPCVSSPLVLRCQGDRAEGPDPGRWQREGSVRQWP